MNLKFIVILWILSLTSCRCGLLNWFNDWTDELNPKVAKIKCREKRKAEENGIKPDITKSTADKPVFLLDIEKGKQTTKSEQEPTTGTHQGNLKTKRYVVSAYNPILGATRKNHKLLPLVKRNSASEEQCNACTNLPTCKLLGQCAQCNDKCKGIAIYTDDLLTPWTNQSVGMVHTTTPPNKKDIFSKTLYPVATYKDGDTKSIICRIAGITDTSDIETVTIWVTTYSNKPPVSLNKVLADMPKMSKNIANLEEHNLSELGTKQTNFNTMPNMMLPSSSKTRMVNEQAHAPNMQGRFNGYDDENDSIFSRLTNNGMEKIKTNPDVIEGPPPFVGSNKLIVVQPKAFESNESDEDDTNQNSSPSSAIPPIKESTTTKNIFKPALLSKLRELASSRTNKLSGLKDRRQKIENGTPLREGLVKNLLKSRQNSRDENSMFQNPPILNSLKDATENMERVTANDNQNPSIRLPDENDDKIAKMNEAIHEVKSMVKNIQEEASKASETRLLGVPHTANYAKDNNDLTSIPSLPSNPIAQIIPNQVADNFKKVNKYLINRAQDALDMIGSKDKTNQPLQPEKVGNLRDEHSEITKDTITNFKKMPQFLLEQFKDTLNNFDDKPLRNPAINVDTNGIKEDASKENIDLTKRFGGDNGNKQDRVENLPGTNNEVVSTGIGSVDDFGEAVVGQPEQNSLENKSNSIVETRPNIEPNSIMETSTTKNYKNKLEKYIAELKEKRQKIYSSNKYLQNPSPKASKVASSSTVMEEPIKSTMQNGSPNQEGNNYETAKAADSNILMSANDLENQREVLKQKLKKFIKEIKSKASTSTPFTSVDEITSSSTPKQIVSHIGFITDKQDQNKYIKPIIEPQPLTDLTQPKFEENPPAEVSDATLPQQFPSDQVVGESKPNNKPEINEVSNFLSTMPKLSDNEANQNTETFNKLKKYLKDLKARQSTLLQPTSDGSIIQNRNQVPESKNELDDKKDLLKVKLKNYVKNLNKPAEETVGQAEIPFNQRLADQISSLNNKVTNDMKNYLGPTTDIFKKDVLKDKLRNYVESLRKPMRSEMVPNFVRKASETQRNELNSLKKRLENLLKAKEPIPSVGLGENPLVSKAKPKVESSISEVPSTMQNIIPIISERVKPIEVQNSNILGDIQHLSIDSPFEQSNDETEINSQTLINQEVNLQKGTDNLDWSHSLGKIVQPKPKDIFFVGSGIKLPLKLTEGPNGSMDLSVDLEKLCSCYNTTACSKNHTALEETVGAILEKEAELNEQLNRDDGKVDSVPGSSLVTKSEFEEDNKKPTVLQKMLSNMNAKRIQKKRSNVFKRSSDVKGLSPELTTIKNVFKKLIKKNKKNINNKVLKVTNLSKLPSLDVVADELTNLGIKVQDSVSNSVQDITNNIAELKEQLDNKLVESSQNPDILLSQNLATLPNYNADWFQNYLNEIQEKADEINNGLSEKLEHENTLKNLLNVNGLRTSSGVDLLNNEYIKNLTPKRIFNSILNTNGLNKIGPPTENPLNMLKNQANDVIKNWEQPNTFNKIMQKVDLNRFRLPKIVSSLTTKDPLISFNEFQEKIKNSLPSVPEVQNRMNEINDNVVKITDNYQFGKTHVLEKKLKQLDDEIQKYYENNEKLLSEESKKLFGSHNSEIVEQEVNIINRIISWIRSLASGING